MANEAGDLALLWTPPSRAAAVRSFEVSPPPMGPHPGHAHRRPQEWTPLRCRSMELRVANAACMLWQRGSRWRCPSPSRPAIGAVTPLSTR
uniref:Uncharacterized protein n=1 Tax=Arundo donax TaxID=35708 RepID=A0A0A9G7E9_ARUDO